MKWINIREKLPEKSQYVLVYMPKETGGFKVMQFYYCGNGEWDDGKGMADTRYYGLTHWMPMPTPPNFKLKSSF